MTESENPTRFDYELILKSFNQHEFGRAIPPQEYLNMYDSIQYALQTMLKYQKQIEMLERGDFVLVPKYPTEAMCRAGESSSGSSNDTPFLGEPWTPENVELIYKDMIKTAQEEQAEGNG